MIIVFIDSKLRVHWAKFLNRHSSKSIWVIKLSYCQNDSPMGGGTLVCLLYIIPYSLCSSTPTSPSGGQQAGSSLAPKESKSSKILSPKKSLLAAKESSSGRRLDKNIKQLFGARMTSKGTINIFPIWVVHIHFRYFHRFFDHVGHQTMYISIYWK